MVSPELISSLRELSRPDKFYIMQLLISELVISELAQQEADLLKPGQAYPIWSPHGADGAAAIMLEALQAAQPQNHA